MSSDAAAALSLPEPDRRGSWLRWRAKRGHGGAHGARGRQSETIHSSVGDVAVSPACLIEIAREAEAAGFESVRIVEYEYDSFAYDQAIAMGTSRVLTGSCIARYFTRHPLLTAETAAVIDQLAPGRFVIGLGPGPSQRADSGLPRSGRACRAHEPWPGCANTSRSSGSP